MISHHVCCQSNTDVEVKSHFFSVSDATFKVFKTEKGTEMRPCFCAFLLFAFSAASFLFIC